MSIYARFPERFAPNDYGTIVWRGRAFSQRAITRGLLMDLNYTRAELGLRDTVRACLADAPGVAGGEVAH